MIDLFVSGDMEGAKFAILPDRGQAAPAKVDDHWETDLCHDDNWRAELTTTRRSTKVYQFKAMLPYHREHIS
jgi:hypothetical protein